MLQFGCLTSFGSITWDPEFCQIWDWCWNIKSISLHFRLFPRKANDKTLFWSHFGHFMPKLVQNEFSFKKRLCLFLHFPIIYPCAKNQVKLMIHLWGGSPTMVLTASKAERLSMIYHSVKKIHHNAIKTNIALSSLGILCLPACLLPYLLNK